MDTRQILTRLLLNDWVIQANEEITDDNIEILFAS
jgi:hypothetical protein